MRPVKCLNVDAIYRWLRDNCWRDGEPVGQCVDTALFVQELFGWMAIHGSLHSWNQAPKRKILDLTVEQFGFSHATRLVPESTVFYDISEMAQPTYLSERNGRKFNTKSWKAWVRRLRKQLDEGTLKGNEFGITRRSLLYRLRKAAK